MNLPEIELRYFKLSHIQLKERNGRVVEVARGENIVMRGVCVLTIPKTNRLKTFVTCLSDFLQPNSVLNLKNEFTHANAKILRRGKPVKERLFPTLFFLHYKYNINNTVLNELSYSVCFGNREYRNMEISAIEYVCCFIELFFGKILFQKFLHVRIRDLNDDWRKIFNVLYQLISLPKIIYVKEFELTDQKLENDFMKQCIRVSKRKDVLFIFIKEGEYWDSCFNCTSKLQFDIGEVKSLTLRNEKYLKKRKEMLRQLLMPNCYNELPNSSVNELNSVNIQSKLNENENLRSTNNKNNILDIPQYEKEKNEIKIKTEEKSTLKKHSIGSDNEIDNDLYEIFYSKNFDGLERKRQKMNVFERFCKFDNYKICYRDVKTLSKRGFEKMIADFLTILWFMLLFGAFISFNIIHIEDKISRNISIFIYDIYKEIITFLYSFTNFSFFKAQMILLSLRFFEVFIKPIFTDYFVRKAIGDSEISDFDDLLLNKYKINAVMISMLCFSSIFILGGYEKDIIRRNVHVLFSPGSYIMSLISCTAILIWLPVSFLSILFGIKFPMIILLTSTFLAMTLLTLGSYSYIFLRNKIIFLGIIPLCQWFNFSYPLYFERRDFFLLHITRKLNPIMIARDCDFITGKMKWSFYGYCVRICVFMFLFCVYQLSKMKN